MQAKIVTEDENLENLALESWYSGERFIIKNGAGFLAAIVPLEDLAVLEEIEVEAKLAPSILERESEILNERIPQNMDY